jgi:hypothetical protein
VNNREKMASEIQGTTLSPKAKENLQRNVELRQKDSKFIKIQPGEKRILQFNPEKNRTNRSRVQWKKDSEISIYSDRA